MRPLSDAKRKELETRALLGPRLGRSKPLARVYAEPSRRPAGLNPRRNRLPGDE